MPSYNIDKLDIYVLSKRLNVQSYAVLKTIRDFSYRDQMVRSCLSVASNIAEGYGRRNPNAFRQFLDYALGSLYEFQTQLELAVANKLVSIDLSVPLVELIDELIPKIINFRKSLRQHPPTTNH
jgi:four helix bundle protein